MMCIDALILSSTSHISTWLDMLQQVVRDDINATATAEMLHDVAVALVKPSSITHSRPELLGIVKPGPGLLLMSGQPECWRATDVCHWHGRHAGLCLAVASLLWLWAWCPRSPGLWPPDPRYQATWSAFGCHIFYPSSFPIFLKIMLTKIWKNKSWKPNKPRLSCFIHFYMSEI